MKILNNKIKLFFNFNPNIDCYLDLFLMDKFKIDILNNFNFPDFKSDLHNINVYFL